MKQKLLILVSAAITVSVSCSPTLPAPTPKIGAPATAAPTAQPAPAETATLARTVVPIVSPTPAEAATRLRTVLPITPAEPSIGKDNMSGVPIPTPLDAGTEKIVLQAKEDLAKRLTINVDQISLVELQSVTWSDGSLGCPQPGMLYTQALVDGYLIRLRATGQIYEYHSGGSRAPFLCQSKP